MSYNGSGVFNINTTGQPVVLGQTISPTVFNAFTADIGTGLTTCLTKDGQSTPTANIKMGTFKITGLGNATTAGDALNYNGPLGTPSSGALTNCTGLPPGGLTGLGTGVATALAVNIGSAGALVTFNGALGTPSSGVVTNLTGTASININGTVGANTPAAGSFTTITGSSLVDISGASAGQVKFPATQNASANANTLDDYAEGTWQPTITFGGGSTGVVYDTQVGYYTKIGRAVFIQCVLGFSNPGSSTGNAAIGGLPFAMGVATNCSFPFGRSTTTAGSAQLYGTIDPSSSAITVSSGFLTVLTQANFASGGGFLFNALYFA